MTKDERYRAILRGHTWMVYDSVRKCCIVKSLSPNATYNEEVAKKIAELLNNQPNQNPNNYKGGII